MRGSERWSTREGDHQLPQAECRSGLTPALWTRHVYAGLEPIEEYVLHDPDGEGGDPCTWTLAREFIWGARFPEPLVMVDWTAAGAVAAGSEEVLHYVRDALGSVVGLLDAGEPDATPEPVPAKLVERYDYDPYGKTYIAHWDPSAGSGSGDWVRHEPDEPSAYGNPFMWTGQRHDVAIGLYHFPFRTYSPRLGRWLQRDPLGYVDGVNMYEYVSCSPLAWVDPLGLLKRTFEGGVEVRYTGEIVYIYAPDANGTPMMDDSGRPMIARVEVVILYTDSGTPIAAYKYLDGHPGGMTNCHGITVGDTTFWIDDAAAAKVFAEQGGDYMDFVSEGAKGEDPGTGFKLGDIVLYFRSGQLVHSMFVSQVDEYGRILAVAGLAGWETAMYLALFERGFQDPYTGWRIYRPGTFWNLPLPVREYAVSSLKEFFTALMDRHYDAMNRIWGPVGRTVDDLLCR